MSPVEIARALYRKGGVEINTPLPPERGRGKGEMLLRSVIQPDGDVILFLSELALDEPHLIDAHMRRIDSVIISLSRFRRALGITEMVLMAGASVLVLMAGWSYREGRMDLALLTALLSALLLLFRPLIRMILRFYTGRGERA